MPFFPLKTQTYLYSYLFLILDKFFFLIVPPPLWNSVVYPKVRINKSLLESFFNPLLLDMYDFFVLDCHKLYPSHMSQITVFLKGNMVSVLLVVNIILCVSLSTLSFVSLRYKRHGPLPY